MAIVWYGVVWCDSGRGDENHQRWCRHRAVSVGFYPRTFDNSLQGTATGGREGGGGGSSVTVLRL